MLSTPAAHVLGNMVHFSFMDMEIMELLPNKIILNKTSKAIFTGYLYGLILVIQVRNLISQVPYVSNRKKEANISSKNGLSFPMLISFNCFV